LFHIWTAAQDNTGFFSFPDFFKIPAWRSCCRESEENFEAQTGTHSMKQSRADILSEPGTPSEAAKPVVAPHPARSIPETEDPEEELGSAACFTRGKGECVFHLS
jgi:hypothetical protein